MADGGEQGLRVLVADDEPPALAELVWLLEQDPLVREAVGVGRAAEALRRLGDGSFDALLTDVRMPGRDGRDLARAVNRLHRPPAVVFVTAYDGHAIEAFDLEVVDYLLKPVRPARLAATLRRVAALRTAGQDAPAGGSGSTVGDSVTVAVELGGVTTLVPRGSIRWVEASGDYVRLHTPDGSHLLRIPLGSLEQQWTEAGFARIHRSLLVNLAAVREVRTDAGRCTLVLGGDPSPVELPVARRHTREVRERLLRRSPGS